MGEVVSNINRTAPPPVIIHDPVDTSKTRANIILYCLKRCIPQRLKFSDEIVWNQDRSRVCAQDIDGLLLNHIKAHPEHWAHGSGANHNKYGIEFRNSWRYIATPSLQVLEIEVHGGGYVLEIDIDEECVVLNFGGHALEVLRHTFAFTENGRRTNPDTIALMLTTMPVLQGEKAEERADA